MRIFRSVALLTSALGALARGSNGDATRAPPADWTATQILGFPELNGGQ